MIKQILNTELDKLRAASPHNNNKLHDKYGSGRIKQETFSIEQLVDCINLLGYDVLVTVKPRQAEETIDTWSSQ